MSTKLVSLFIYFLLQWKNLHDEFAAQNMKGFLAAAAKYPQKAIKPGDYLMTQAHRKTMHTPAFATLQYQHHGHST